MRYRDLGSTGIRVSEVGFGAWAIGGHMWGPQDDGDSVRALHQALDLGVNFFDTALAYGDGHSERLIGKVLAERPGEAAVATKVPPKNWNWANPPGTPLSDVFPSNHVVACAERSLSNLGTDRLDLLQLHTWRPEWGVQAGELLSAVERLKREGKIRAFGISLPDAEPLAAADLVRLRQVDALQVFFNLMYQEPAESLFPLAAQYGVGIVARVPLAFGALTGKFTPATRFEGDDHRAGLYAGENLRRVLARVKALSFLRQESPGGLAEAALRFVLSYAEVSTVIPGIRNPAQARANAAAGELGPLPPKVLARCRELYRRNFGEPVRRVKDLGNVPAVFRSSVALREDAVKAGRKRSVARRAAKATVKERRKPVKRKAPRKPAAGRRRRKEETARKTGGGKRLRRVSPRKRRK